RARSAGRREARPGGVGGRRSLVGGAGRNGPAGAAAPRGPGGVEGGIQGRSTRLVVREGAAPPDPAALGAIGARVAPAPPRFEDAFVDLLGGGPKGVSPLAGSGRAADAGDSVVEADGLTKRFGAFTAADRVTFTI